MVFFPEHCSTFWQSWTVSWVRDGIWIIIFNSQGWNYPSQIFPIFLKHTYPFLLLQLVVMSHNSTKLHVKAIVFWLFKTCCLAISLLFSSHQFTFISTVKHLKTTGHIWWVIRWFVILSTLSRESERKVSKILKWWEEGLQSLLAVFGLSLAVMWEKSCILQLPYKTHNFSVKKSVKGGVQNL